VGQFIGTHKPDGYNTEEELEKMALFRAISQKDDCSCECCEERWEAKETQEHKDDLSRAKLRLRIKAQVKLGKEAGERPSRKLLLLTDKECKDLVSWASYTGDPLTPQQIIQQAYPSHELIIEMNDDRIFTLNTDGYGLDVIVGRYIDLEAYLKAHGMFEDWHANKEFFENQRADIVIPGAKNIYYMEC
jgi:hypothetical protein